MSWWGFAATDELGYGSIFTRPLEFFDAAWSQILVPIERRLGVIEKHILVGYSDSYSILVLFFSAISLVFLKVVHALYYLYFVLWYIAWRRGWLFPVSALYRPWMFLVLVSLLILFLFVVAEWFLTGRYVLPVALLLLMAAPFVLDRAYLSVKDQSSADVQAKGGRRNRRLFGLVIVLIVLSGMKSLDLSTKKHYLKAAAEWMTQNIPADASVYTNDRILGYYLQRDAKVGYYWPDWQYFKSEALFARRNQQYGAINIKHSDPDYIRDLPVVIRRKLIAEFVNEKGTRVMVFDFRQPYDAAQRPEPVYIK